MPGISGFRMTGVRKLMAKKPSTIVGIPAIVSRTGLTRFLVFGVAYSARIDGSEQPSGTASTSAMAATSSVPATSGITPKRYGWIEAGPDGSGEVLERADDLEELDRLEHQDHDDPDRRGDADRRREEQEQLDDPFASGTAAAKC